MNQCSLLRREMWWQAMAPYPARKKRLIDQLFLAYTGYSIGKDGTPHYQFWEPPDFVPLLAHINRLTGYADGRMFSDFLFLALGILNEYGEGRHLIRNEKTPANRLDWGRYMDELFGCNRNLDALALAMQYVPISTMNVWIALPYPNPSVFHNDMMRIQAVFEWADECMVRWKASGWGRYLQLKGFYWIQESLYYQGPVYDDRLVVTEVNKLVRRLTLDGKPMHTIWIPYAQATGWSEWRSLGFDLSILQPNYYFDPVKKIETSAASAYESEQGVEMEFDLAVTYDQEKRARFIEYMNLGATGGYDEQGRYFGPYMLEAPLGWYTGGWFFGKKGRQQALVYLYLSGDPLYDQIYSFMKGTYTPIDPSQSQKPDFR